MKRKGKEIIYGLILSLVMGVLPNMPRNILSANAAETPLDTKVYALPGDLAMGWDLSQEIYDDNSDDDIVQGDYVGKVFLGKNKNGKALEWFVLGSDSGTGMDTVLFADESIVAQYKYSDAMSGEVLEYAYEAGTGYGDTAGTIDVSPQHYGASKLRTLLNQMTDPNDTTLSYFSANEKQLMLPSTLTIHQNQNGMGSYTEYKVTDKLYAPYGGSETMERSIYAGTTKNKSVSWSYWGGDNAAAFWTNQNYYSDDASVIVAQPFNNFTYYTQAADEYIDIRPITDIDLTNVKFASAAKAVKTDEVGEKIPLGTAMGLRMDGSSITKSTVYRSSEHIMVYPKENENISLIVQGNDGTDNWYYSKAISGTTSVLVSATDIVDSGAVANVPDLTTCKVWIEKNVDGMAYAKDVQEVIPITNAQITGVAQPVAGKNMNTTANCSEAGVDNVSVTYNPNHQVADYDTEYEANILITVQEGYCFASSCVLTVNGDSATYVLNEDGTIESNKSFDRTAKAKVLGITAPGDITGVASGTAKTEVALGLPTSVAVSVEDNEISSLPVVWDLDNLVSGTYDPAVRTKQIFTVGGTITFPEKYDLNNMSTTVQVKVTVLAATDGTDNPPAGDENGNGTAGQPDNNTNNNINNNTNSNNNANNNVNSNATNASNNNSSAGNRNELDEVPETGETSLTGWLLTVAFVAGLGYVFTRKRER